MDVGAFRDLDDQFIVDMAEGTAGRSFSFRANRNQVLTFLGMIGVIVHPIMADLRDSERAMSHSEPWDDNSGKMYND